MYCSSLQAGAVFAFGRESNQLIKLVSNGCLSDTLFGDTKGIQSETNQSLISQSINLFRAQQGYRNGKLIQSYTIYIPDWFQNSNLGQKHSYL